MALTTERSHVSVKDLAKQHSREHREIEILYDRLISEFSPQIRKADQDGRRNILYEAPLYVAMYPKYDISRYILYCIEHYRKKGFDVRFTFPNRLCIFWNRQEEIQDDLEVVERLLDENRRTQLIIERIRPDKKYLPGKNHDKGKKRPLLEYK